MRDLPGEALSLPANDSPLNDRDILQKRLGRSAKIGHSDRQEIFRPLYWAAFIEFRLWAVDTDD